MLDRHLLIICAPRHADSSKQLKLFKNAEKWDAAKTAVVAAMMEAHVSILRSQSLNKHFKSKNCLGNRGQTGKHPNLWSEPGSTFVCSMTVEFLAAEWPQLNLKSRQCLQPSLSLSWNARTRHGRQAFMEVKLSGSLPWGICAPYTVDISRQTCKASRQDCLQRCRSPTTVWGMQVVRLGWMGVDQPPGKGI